MAVKDSVLQALLQNRNNYISGEKLSEELGVSRAAVWKAIRSLREAGYRVDAVTNRGYCLLDRQALLSAEEIRRFLPAKYRGNKIYVYEVLDSTNNKARQIAVGGSSDTVGSFHDAVGGSSDTVRGSSDAMGVFSNTASVSANANGSREHASAGVHGTVVAALQQTAGKGRLGRGFFSPTEGVYLSIIVKPDFDLSKSVLVTVATAAAVAEAVDEICGQKQETMIKWVNDVYLNGGKICGILTEGITDFESGQIDHLVIGIGINTSLEGFPEELLQTAAAVEGDYSRSELAAGIICRVLDYLENIEDRTFMDTYRKKSFLVGRDVHVFKGTYRKDPAKELSGIPARVLGIDENGGLQVIYTDGSRETLTTGEVTIRI